MAAQHVSAAEHHRAAAVEPVENVQPVVLPCLPEERQPHEQDEKQAKAGNGQVAAERRRRSCRTRGVGFPSKQKPSGKSGRDN